MRQPVNVLIACNHNILRKVIAKILSEDPVIRLAEELGNGQDSLEADARRLFPNTALTI